MVQLRALSSAVKLDLEDLPRVLAALRSADERVPALHTARTALFNLAGVGTEVALEMLATARSRTAPRGDVFFVGDDTYYLFVGDEPARLEVGLVAKQTTDMEGRLHAFASDVQASVMRAVDGRKTRHMNFQWETMTIASGRLEKFLTAGPEEGQPQFERPRLAAAEVAAAQVLSGSAARAMMIEIGQAGFAREQDILARRGRAKEEATQALGELKSGSLIDVEYLLECRKTRNPLTRLRSRDDLESEAVSRLRCPACSAAFRDELVSEGYSRSELGRRMIDRSYWMTVWVTERIVQAGVALDSILWNLAQSGEEVDILADVLGGLWIFELKDREFGSGDAHPLNYRQVRYAAERAVIVTTERVSPDAKRVFEEVAKESSRRRIPPVFIEGLDRTDQLLRGQIDAAYLRQISRKLMAIGGSYGVDLRPIISRKYGALPEPDGESFEAIWLDDAAFQRELFTLWDGPRV